MKLIKLSEEHYIICDDSEIKTGDWYYDSNDVESLIPIYQRSQQFADYSGCKKITHSTEPLDKSLFFTDRVWGCERLSLGIVKELLGVVDVEKKANKQWGNVHRTGVLGYIDGYNQALEDNNHKKWTDADVIRIVEKSRQTSLTAEYLMLSLQLQTEWEVEMVDGKLKLK